MAKKNDLEQGPRDGAKLKLTKVAIDYFPSSQIRCGRRYSHRLCYRDASLLVAFAGGQAIIPKATRPQWLRTLRPARKCCGERLLHLFERSDTIKGPSGRTKFDVRRVWECPACARRERSAPRVVNLRCICSSTNSPWMRLVEESRVRRVAPAIADVETPPTGFPLPVPSDVSSTPLEIVPPETGDSPSLAPPA